MIELTENQGGVILPVRAQAGGRAAEIRGLAAGALKVSVTAPRQKGKANRAIIALLADSLGLKKAQIVLISGASSSQKRFLINGLSAGQLLQRIGHLVDLSSEP